MRISVPRQSFLAGLQLAAAVAPQKTTIATIKNLKLTASSDGETPRVAIEATDLEVGLCYQVPVDEVGEAGELILPPQRLIGILRESDDEVVSLNSDGAISSLDLSSGRYKMIGIEAQDFPSGPCYEDLEGFVLAGADLRSLIRKSAYASSQDAARYALTGVLLEFQKSRLCAVATDGKRLAFADTKVVTGLKGMVSAIVPTKALALVDRLLALDDDQEVGIVVGESQILFRTPSAVITSRLIEGKFPEYKKVVPKGATHKAIVSVAEFVHSLRLVMPMTESGRRSVRMALNGPTLTLFTHSKEIGEATVSFPVEYHGAEVNSTCNPEYLMDALCSVSSEIVSVELRPYPGALVIRDGRNYAVIMPQEDME